MGRMQNGPDRRFRSGPCRGGERPTFRSHPNLGTSSVLYAFERVGGEIFSTGDRSRRGRGG